MRVLLLVAVCAALPLPACCRVDRDPNEPGLLGGEAIVERICTDERFARTRLRARCALPDIDIVRVRALVDGHDFAAVSIRDARLGRAAGPDRTRVEYTLEGDDVTARGFGAIGTVRGLDEPTAKRLLEARLVDSYWWRFHDAADYALLGSAWPAAAARVAREPAGFARDAHGWTLRYWGRSSVPGCRQITRIQTSIDARTGVVARPTGRIYGEPVGRRPGAPDREVRCGLPLDD